MKLVDDEDSSTGSNSTSDVSFCDNCRISCMKKRQMIFVALFFCSIVDFCTVINVAAPVLVYLLVKFACHHLPFSLIF